MTATQYGCYKSNNMLQELTNLTAQDLKNEFNVHVEV